MFQFALFTAAALPLSVFAVVFLPCLAVASPDLSPPPTSSPGPARLASTGQFLRAVACACRRKFLGAFYVPSLFFRGPARQKHEALPAAPQGLDDPEQCPNPLECGQAEFKRNSSQARKPTNQELYERVCRRASLSTPSSRSSASGRLRNSSSTGFFHYELSVKQVKIFRC